jgi:hypothetical protein
VQTFPYISYVQDFVGDRLGADDYLQNTCQEFDGSDSGARPDEAVSWGKIRAGAESVKVGKSIPRLVTDIHLPAGICRCDAGVSVACRCDIRSGYRVSTDMTSLLLISFSRQTVEY